MRELLKSWAWWLGGLVCCTGCLAGAEPDPGGSFADQARQQYEQAKQNYKMNPGKAEAAWRFGRACFDWAEYAQSKKKRAEIAEEGIAACRKAVEKAPESAAAHYYLALNQGQLARTKYLRALKIVDRMEEHLKRARMLDAEVDHGGPDRALGLLYRDAPGWPAGVGDRAKSVEHMKQALEISPVYPGGHLNLVETFLEWDQPAEFKKAFETAAQAMEKAREKFAEPKWDPDWAEWNRRWENLQNQMKSLQKED
jgi:tetratricopeptide (TPR) repeat protein